jgi:hypothetical protein
MLAAPAQPAKVNSSGYSQSSNRLNGKISIDNRISNPTVQKLNPKPPTSTQSPTLAPLASQQPQRDGNSECDDLDPNLVPAGTYLIKSYALWDVLDHMMRKVAMCPPKQIRITRENGSKRVEYQYTPSLTRLEIQTVYNVFTDNNYSEEEKHFAATLIKVWPLLAIDPSDPPPILIGQCLDSVWNLAALHNRRIDTNQDGLFSEEEIVTALNNCKNSDKNSNSNLSLTRRERAALWVLLENYAYIARLSHHPKYKYI